MPIKLHQLKAFETVAQTGSIRSASRLLNVSQPALTKNIKELEESLGVSLMMRNSNGIALTRLGEEFLQHTQLVLRELDLAQETIKQHLDASSGHVSIGLGGSLACSLLPNVIAKFRQKFPSVKLNIAEGQVESHLLSLRQGEFDFCINTAKPELNNNDLAFEPLLNMEYQIFARKGHPLATATKLTDLKDCDWVLPVMRTGFHKQALDILVQHKLNPNIAITCNSYFTTAEMLKKTDCLSIFATTTKQCSCSEDGLVALELDHKLPTASYYLIKRKNSPLPPLANKLAELFQQECRPLFSRRKPDNACCG